ncbi:MAG: DUF4434 domain-containing protein [Firmicutes bacterium]|nr:DUF4434 domain-containing protein [Bacillota bacterium]MDD4693280.1 DUF4434 domain-containing protein [Bacillota bacterium]
MKLGKFILPLLLISTLTLVSDAKITGAFWQLNSGNTNKPRSYWQTELDLMQQIGMDTLIVQYSATDTASFYDTFHKTLYQFKGPFAPGTYDIIIEKGPLIVYEIVASTPFTYELKGALPSSFFGDDGTKLDDGIDDTINSSVVWTDSEEEIIISVILENATDSILLVAGSLSPQAKLPRESQVTLDQKQAVFLREGDYSFLLEEASKRGMKVWLGLKLSGDWWSGNLDLNKDCEENLELAKTLLDLYGHYESFYGFYIPHELYPSGSSLPQNYLHFFRDLTVGLQELGKPVSIAPYFGGNMMPKSHGRYWEAFFKEVPLDVLMLQDGVGCHRLPLEQIPRYYNEVYAVCQDHGVEFWSDLEVFNQLPGDGFSADPADFSRVKEQVITQTPTVDKIVIFDWPHYMSPNRNAKAKALYDEYSAWIESEK